MRKDNHRGGTQEVEGIEKVIQIDRVTKVVKGGKRLAFRAFVIIGDMDGTVGYGLGKSKEVPGAIKKGIEKAKRQQYKINLVNGTLPHAVVGGFGASRVVINPARPGTGVIAGGAVRILLEAAGLKNVVAKSLGSGNSINAAKAAINGLMQCRDLEKEEKRRGKKLPVYVTKQEKVKAQKTIETEPEKEIVKDLKASKPVVKDEVKKTKKAEDKKSSEDKK
jgi:small subunit ribosomal protein S5